MPETELDKIQDESVNVYRALATPLKPTVWMTGVLVWATVIALILKVPLWAGIFLCVMTGLSFLLFLGTYLFLLATNPEALRSEKLSMKQLPSSQPSLQVNIPKELLENDPLLLTSAETPTADKPKTLTN